MTPVLLRPTRTDEIPTVLAWEADPDTAPWIGDSTPRWHAQAVAAPAVDHLTAIVGGHRAGFVVLAAPRGGETGTELRRIVVATEHRGHGHGRAVLRAALDRAARHGTGRVWLDVGPGNRRALALYRSEGFTVERALPSDLRDPDGPAALVFLSRDYSAGSSGRPS